MYVLPCKNWYWYLIDTALEPLEVDNSEIERILAVC